MATFFDSASLVMIPSGYKDDKLYSIKPTDGSGDFTFSRDGAGASPATRVNASGLIEKGRSNELTYSNTFSNAIWGKNQISITGGQSGYDGSSDAWLMTDDSTNNEHKLSINPSFSGVVTMSVYAKAGTLNWIWLRGVFNGGNERAWFNLSTGELGFADANIIDHNIEAVGATGWYRCSITINQQTAFDYFIGLSNADAQQVYLGDSTGTIFVQDAQLEQGLVATDYIETTTAAVSAGLLGDMPRLDYSGGATCPSLLLEPSRVNSLANSEYLGSSDWTKNGFGTGVAPVLTFGQESPEGLNNAYEITFNTGAGTSSADSSVLGESIGGQSAGSYTLSFYAKVSSGTDKIIARHAGGATYTTCDLTDQWKRFEITETLASAGSVYIDIGLRRGLANEPLNSSVTCQIYGVQLEAGSYPTSYIPTYGSASTRGADDCIDTSASAIIGQTEGTIFYEGLINTEGSTNYVYFEIVNGTDANNAIVLYMDFVSGTLSVYNSDAGGVNLLKSGNNKNTNLKIAYAYSGTDIVAYINGVQVYSQTAGVGVPTGMDRVLIGRNRTGGEKGFAEVKQALLFKTRLTNAELASLTTL